MVRTQPQHLDCSCLGLGNLEVSHSSCFRPLTWQLGTEMVLQLSKETRSVRGWTCRANATKRLRQFRNRSHFSRDAKRIYEKTYYSHASSVVSTVTLVVDTCKIPRRNTPKDDWDEIHPDAHANSKTTVHKVARCLCSLVFRKRFVRKMNIKLTESRGLHLPDEPQEGRNRSWAGEEFSATL
ncbi:hypothetical protein CSKR_111711 [Clonorchis sinensis]|uniref:Uncharacterized protein n=1 Tax=Clonorchis sinensis TaxID=79923 RepID=A0A3R7GM58_CLOSI|nr:hypothetical protein CSKR_111711 [Clonorchis sinensis]